MRRRHAKRDGLGRLGRPVPSCNVRILVGFGKGKPLPRSVLRRSIDPVQATNAVNAILSRSFVGYTVTPTRGVFGGDGEPGVAVDLYRTQFDRGAGACGELARRARCAASDIRAALRQHSVLVVVNDPGNRRSPVTADLITKAGAGRCPRGGARAAAQAAGGAG